MNHEDFNAAVAAFLTSPHGAGWCVVSETDALQRTHAILVKDFRVLTRGSAAEPPAFTSGTAETEHCWSESDDDAAAGEAQEDCGWALSVRLRLCWSPTYGMPTAYFDVHEPNGAAVYCAHDLSHRFYNDALNVDGEGAGLIITRAADELTGRVSFFVHPCDLHDALKPYLAALTSRDVCAAQQHVAALAYVAGLSKAALRLEG